MGEVCRCETMRCIKVVLPEPAMPMQMTATGGVAMVGRGRGGIAPTTVRVHEQWVSRTLKRSYARAVIRRTSDRGTTTARAGIETRIVKLAEKMRDTGTSDGGATMRATMRNGDGGGGGIVIAATLHPDPPPRM